MDKKLILGSKDKLPIQKIDRTNNEICPFFEEPPVIAKQKFSINSLFLKNRTVKLLDMT